MEVRRKSEASNSFYSDCWRCWFDSNLGPLRPRSSAVEFQPKMKINLHSDRDFHTSCRRCDQQVNNRLVQGTRGIASHGFKGHVKPWKDQASNHHDFIKIVIYLILE